MERHQRCAALGLSVAVLLSGCSDSTTPVQPTRSPAATADMLFSLSGWVSDAANRPVSGSRVEVTEGPNRGTTATTDASGRFSMPGTFSSTITVTASKDGYVSQARTIPPSGRLPGQPGGTFEVAFSLELVGPYQNIAGDYSLTVTAARACTDLPAAARTRTFKASIVPGGRSSSFVARLRDAQFFSTVPCPIGRIPASCTYNQVGIGMAGDYAALSVGVIEQLDGTSFLVFSAGAEGSFGAAGITAPLRGTLLYCSSEPYEIDVGEWACRDTGVQCESNAHQLTLLRQ